MPERLLIVEDDRALIAMLTERLTEEGYLVDAAYDGQQGLHADSPAAMTA